MDNLLSKAQEKPSLFYMTLVNPIFKRQTTPNSSGVYWIVFESEGILYKFKHNLYR